jgi:myo-inositol 2-dehydrogenase/D-chiro-inositol 1-dehydrogenase
MSGPEQRMVAFALFGCGRIGRMHARNLARHPRAELVAVYDVATALAEEVAREVGTRAAPSVEAVLADPGVEAVLIASSTDTHVPLITAAAKAGKAVLCEKPIDLNTARAGACWREIEPLRPLVMIGFNRRFDPSFRALRERVAGGEIGRVEQVVITSRDPSPPGIAFIRSSGGFLHDMTIHDFDMTRALAGEIVEVQAFGANLIDRGIEEAGDFDSAMVILRTATGALAHINNSRRCVYGYDQRIEVFGARGMLQAGNQRATSVEAWNGTATAARDPVLPFFMERYDAAYAAEIDHFVTCLAEGTAPMTSFADGLAALRVADAALESARSGRVARVPA